MRAWKSQINLRSSEFRANADMMRALVDDLRTKVTDVAQGGGAAWGRHTARGKLLPRDRVSQLLDPGTAFLDQSKTPKLLVWGEDDGFSSLA
jgi:3-methylcrotonyl-CoA carboxylase beta subunit